MVCNGTLSGQENIKLILNNGVKNQLGKLTNTPTLR